MTPFYVKITAAGPNNTCHPLHKISVRKGEGFQCFKVVQEDTVHRTNDGVYSTYITEDNYCLWSHCVEQCTMQEYNEERGIMQEDIPLIFN